MEKKLLSKVGPEPKKPKFKAVQDELSWKQKELALRKQQERLQYATPGRTKNRPTRPRRSAGI